MHKFLLAVSIVFCLISCSKNNQNSDFDSYIGKYPTFIQPNDSIQVPFLKLPEIEKVMKSSLPSGVMEEMKSLTTEMPIEEVDRNYLYVVMCEQHNCPHSIHIFFNKENLELTAILFNDDSEGAKSYCFSNSFPSVREIAFINNADFLANKLMLGSEATHRLLATRCQNNQSKYTPVPPVNHDNA
jgi:hypothetical protein